MNRLAYYVRFHNPVPPAVNKEPVAEFVLSGKQDKYVVQHLEATELGVYFQAYNEQGFVPWANIHYCRLMKEEPPTAAKPKGQSKR